MEQLTQHDCVRVCELQAGQCSDGVESVVSTLPSALAQSRQVLEMDMILMVAQHHLLQPCCRRSGCLHPPCQVGHVRTPCLVPDTIYYHPHCSCCDLRCQRLWPDGSRYDRTRSIAALSAPVVLDQRMQRHACRRQSEGILPASPGHFGRHCPATVSHCMHHC